MSMFYLSCGPSDKLPVKNNGIENAREFLHIILYQSLF